MLKLNSIRKKGPSYQEGFFLTPHFSSGVPFPTGHETRLGGVSADCRWAHSESGGGGGGGPGRDTRC